MRSLIVFATLAATRIAVAQPTPPTPAPVPDPAGAPAPAPDPAATGAAEAAVDAGSDPEAEVHPGLDLAMGEGHGHGKGKHHDKGKAKRRRKGKGPRVHGFMQVFARKAFATGSDGRVDASNVRVQRARLKVDGRINRWLGYDLEIDPRAPDITGVMRDAYLTIRKVIPHHQIRIGQQKTQFGYENRESSTRLFAVNRTDVSDNLSRGATLRDVGVGIIGGWPLGGGFALEDAFTVVNGNGMNTQNDDTSRKSYWGRAGARYAPGAFTARLGVSGALGDYIEPADPLDPIPMSVHVDFKRIGVDVELDHPWVFVSAELVWSRDKVPTETADTTGYYVNVVGKSPYHAGPIVRYDVLGDELQRWTFGGYYDLAHARLRLMVNYEYRRLFNVVRGDDKLYFWTQVKF